MSDHYRAQLDYLRSLDPENSLISLLEKGESLINRKILEKEMAKLPPPMPKKDEPKEKDPIRQRFAIQIRNQINSRAKLSNQFHLAKSDQERKELSKRIVEINEKINAIRKNIEYYEEKKELPELPKSDKFPIPENPIDLIMKRNSLRSNISQTEKTLRSMLRKKAEERQIAEKEQHLHQLKIHLAYVEQAIEHQAVHAG
jgi:hypothetical protein